MRTKRTALCKNPAWCHICGLPISLDIVSQKHPLFLTIDHIVPLSQGGRNTWENRAPAHGFCNRRKGNKQELTAPEVVKLQDEILAYMKSYNRKQTRELKKAALKMAIAGYKEGKKNSPSKLRFREEARAVHIWENEGGACR